MKKNVGLIEKLDEFDKTLSFKIHKMNFDKYLEALVYLFARMFNPDWIFLYFFIMFITSSDKLFILKPFVQTLTCLILTLLLKKLLKRPRPDQNLIKNSKRINNLREKENNNSLPSGDSLQAANFAIIVLCYYNFNIFIIVPFVMFARVFYHCHYIGDTILGSILGFITSYSVYCLFNII